MKRSKEIIINRRIMHRYQQQYRLWRPIIMGMPILRINADVVEKIDEKEWARLCRSNVLFVDTDKTQENQPRIVCGPNFQAALEECLTNKKTTEMKVQVNDKVIDIAEGYIRVIDGRLKNFNTGRDEGIEGDVVEYWHGNKWYKGHVVGYTDYQLVETEEWGRVILEANDARQVKYIHKNRVVEI